MMNINNPNDYYTWRLTLSDGRIIDELENRKKKNTGDFVDHHNPPVQAITIELVPVTDSMSLHRVQIPDGALPICYKKNVVNLLDNQRVGLVFNIGYQLNNIKLYNKININTNTVEALVAETI
jgi:hypothetical protein